MQLNNVWSSGKANALERFAFAEACSSFSGFALQNPRAKSDIIQIARMVRSETVFFQKPTQMYSLIIHIAFWRVGRYN